MSRRPVRRRCRQIRADGRTHRITFPTSCFMSLVASPRRAQHLGSLRLRRSRRCCSISLHRHGALARLVRSAGAGTGWAVLLGGMLAVGDPVACAGQIGMLPHFSFIFTTRRAPHPEADGPAVLASRCRKIPWSSTPSSPLSCQRQRSWLYYADRMMEFPAGLLGGGAGHHPAASLEVHADAKPPSSPSSSTGACADLLLTCRGAGIGDSRRATVGNGCFSTAPRSRDVPADRSALVPTVARRESPMPAPRAGSNRRVKRRPSRGAWRTRRLASAWNFERLGSRMVPSAAPSSRREFHHPSHNRGQETLPLGRKGRRWC